MTKSRWKGLGARKAAAVKAKTKEKAKEARAVGGIEAPPHRLLTTYVAYLRGKKKNRQS